MTPEELADILAGAHKNVLNRLCEVVNATFVEKPQMDHPDFPDSKHRHAVIREAWMVFFMNVPGMPGSRL